MKTLFPWIFTCLVLTVSCFGQQDDSRQRNEIEAQDRRDFEGVVKEGIGSNVPIEFLGKVVDQNGKGTAGVKVKTQICVFNEAVKFENVIESEKEVPLEAVTDQQGFFSIHGVKGRQLEVQGFEKDGYKPDPSPNAPRDFQFSNAPQDEIFKPDPKNPILFHLWKSVGGEPLLHVGDGFWNEKGAGYRITVGETDTIDLIKRQKIAGDKAPGDFRVQLKRPLKIDPRKPYPWSFVMEAVDGGIVETGDIFLYRAPETGYKPRYEVAMVPGDPKWSNQVETKLYLRSRDGKVYSSIQMTFISGKEDYGGIRLNYFSNASGSRNLEPDPTKAIDPERIAKVGVDKAIEEVKSKAGK